MFTADGNNMKDIELSIFVPCYNEQNDIALALNNIKEGVRNIDFEVLIADDCSTDKSIEVIKKFINENPEMNIKLFCNSTNKGLGHNFWEISHKAIGKYYMIIFGDGGIPPKEIQKLVSNIGKADIVLAYFDDKRINFRKKISKLFVYLVNLLTSNKIKYYNSDNIYLLEDVKSYKNGGLGFAYQAELISYLTGKNKNYIEVEINIPFETDKSLSKISHAFKIKNILSVILTLFKILLMRIFYLFK